MQHSNKEDYIRTTEMQTELTKLDRETLDTLNRMSTWYFKMFLVHSSKSVKFTSDIALTSQKTYHAGGNATKDKREALIAYLKSLAPNIGVVDLQTIYNNFNYTITPENIHEFSATTTKPKSAITTKPRRTSSFSKLKSSILSPFYSPKTRGNNRPKK